MAFIRPSASPWGSGCAGLIVMTKDGSMRCVLDYRELTPLLRFTEEVDMRSFQSADFWCLQQVAFSLGHIDLLTASYGSIKEIGVSALILTLHLVLGGFQISVDASRKSKSGMIACFDSIILRDLECLDVKLCVRGSGGYWTSMRIESNLMLQIKEAQRDDDPKFTSRFWKGLQKAWGTRLLFLKFCTAFHPQTGFDVAVAKGEIEEARSRQKSYAVSFDKELNVLDQGAKLSPRFIGPFEGFGTSWRGFVSSELPPAVYRTFTILFSCIILFFEGVIPLYPLLTVAILILFDQIQPVCLCRGNLIHSRSSRESQRKTKYIPLGEDSLGKNALERGEATGETEESYARLVSLITLS
ncbi:hypothetical protein Tco_1032623 [Tanacetum coccineum]|uniref:Uncharacterized protein n=1 Tax=Tanacetum coccineum TaxID=301880 RepID=A0ABQ5GCC3_9ASTR